MPSQPCHELAFANHVRQFDAGQNSLRCSKRCEAGHPPGDPFNGAMVLPDDIGEILDLADVDRDFSFCLQIVESSLVGAALVHRHRVRGIAVLHRLAEETPGRCRIALRGQQKSTVLPCLFTAR